MNQTALLRIAEKLERLAGRLPSKIRNAVLSELTPLKELFLQQRPPRFLFIGSSKRPMPEIIDVLFAPDSHEGMNVTLTPVHRWTEWTIPGHGTVSILDARDAGDSADLSSARRAAFYAGDRRFSPARIFARAATATDRALRCA